MDDYDDWVLLPSPKEIEEAPTLFEYLKNDLTAKNNGPWALMDTKLGEFHDDYDWMHEADATACQFCSGTGSDLEEDSDIASDFDPADLETRQLFYDDAFGSVGTPVFFDKSSVANDWAEYAQQLVEAYPTESHKIHSVLWHTTPKFMRCALDCMVLQSLSVDGPDGGVAWDEVIDFMVNFFTPGNDVGFDWDKDMSSGCGAAAKDEFVHEWFRLYGHRGPEAAYKPFIESEWKCKQEVLLAAQGTEPPVIFNGENFEEWEKWVRRVVFSSPDYFWRRTLLVTSFAPGIRCTAKFMVLWHGCDAWLYQVPFEWEQLLDDIQDMFSGPVLQWNWFAVEPHDRYLNQYAVQNEVQDNCSAIPVNEPEKQDNKPSELESSCKVSAEDLGSAPREVGYARALAMKGVTDDLDADTGLQCPSTTPNTLGLEDEKYEATTIVGTIGVQVKREPNPKPKPKSNDLLPELEKFIPTSECDLFQLPRLTLRPCGFTKHTDAFCSYVEHFKTQHEPGEPTTAELKHCALSSFHHQAPWRNSEGCKDFICKTTDLIDGLTVRDYVNLVSRLLTQALHAVNYGPPDICTKAQCWFFVLDDLYTSITMLSAQEADKHREERYNGTDVLYPLNWFVETLGHFPVNAGSAELGTLLRDARSLVGNDKRLSSRQIVDRLELCFRQVHKNIHRESIMLAGKHTDNDGFLDWGCYIEQFMSYVDQHYRAYKRPMSC